MDLRAARGTETVVMHPRHHLDADALRAAGIGRRTVRIATGLEHPEDLCADLGQALAKV